MAGANTIGNVGGIGFLVTDENEPNETLVTHMGQFYVCIRRSKTWKEVIAQFAYEEHAELFIQSVSSDLAADEDLSPPVSRDAQAQELDLFYLSRIK